MAFDSHHSSRAFGYFALFKVTRRKGGTNSRRNQKTGYPPNPPANQITQFNRYFHIFFSFQTLHSPRLKHANDSY
jgi:hypothetical protein